MTSFIKFWIASTLLLALISWWPLSQQEEWSRQSSSPRQRVEAIALEEARLIEEFALSDDPSGKGRALNPKAWEKALDARISLRESPGEAVGQIGGAPEQLDAVAKLKPGMGVLVENARGLHFIYDTKRTGKGAFLVISREGKSIKEGSPVEGSPPSALAMALALGLVGGALLTLLARVALRPPPTESR